MKLNNWPDLKFALWSSAVSKLSKSTTEQWLCALSRCRYIFITDLISATKLVHFLLSICYISNRKYNTLTKAPREKSLHLLQFFKYYSSVPVDTPLNKTVSKRSPSEMSNQISRFFSPENSPGSFSKNEIILRTLRAVQGINLPDSERQITREIHRRTLRFTPANSRARAQLGKRESIIPWRFHEVHAGFTVAIAAV